MFGRRVIARASRSYATAAGGGGAKTKAASGASGGAETDVVKRVFSEQQQKFRALLEKSKTLSPPVGGDATAVKAYAAKKLAILKEVRAFERSDDDRAGRRRSSWMRTRSINPKGEEEPKEERAREDGETDLERVRARAVTNRVSGR